MSTPVGTLISNQSSPFLVPTEEIKANKEPKRMPDPPFQAWIIALSKRIEAENASEELMRNRKATRNHHYYRGRQSGYFSTVTNQWVDVESDNVAYTKNYVRALVKKVAAQWAASNTELKVHARSDSQEDLLGARMADKLIEYYQVLLLQERTKQREAKFCLLSGEVYRYWYWDAEAGPWIDQPIYEDKTIQLSPDQYSCPTCQSTGEADQNTFSCPMCGSMDIALQPGMSVDTQVQSGTRRVKAGDIVLDIVDALEVKVDLHARTEDESPYLRRRRMVLKETMQAKFKGFKLPENSTTDQTLFLQRQLETSPGNTATGTTATNTSVSSGSASNMVQFDQLWLEPVIYAEYVFPVETALGPEDQQVVIPQGTKAIEMFPDGMYVAMVGAQIVDIRPEDKKKHWALIVNDLIPGSIHGDGIDDVIEIQDMLNDTHSIRFEKLMRETNPPLFYDQRMFRSEQFQNKPGATNPVQNLMPGMKIADGLFMATYESGNAMRNLDEFIEITQRDMVEFVGAQSLMGSAPDTQNGTATAAQLNHDQAQGLSAVPLALRAEVDVKMFTSILELIKENWDAPRYLPLLGKHSKQEGFWFEKANIPRDFVITKIDHSWIPRNETERRNDFIASMQISPALPLGPFTPGIPGYLARTISERFNTDIDEDGYRGMARRATYMLTKLLENGKTVEDQLPMESGDPMVLLAAQQAVPSILAKVPLNPFVDNPQIHTEVITDWFLTDDGLEASQFMTTLLNGRLQELTQIGAIQQMRAMASNPMAAQEMQSQDQSSEPPQSGERGQ